MILSGKHLIMRAVSLLLIAVMACIQPMNSLSEKTAYAASSNKLYIGEVKLFIKTGGKESDAQSWCDSQDANKDDDDTNDWAVVPGDLNEGASGALKSDVAVFLCYQKTKNADEAVTDLAVMNEQGNYSEGVYEQILNEQRDLYKDMVNDLKSMLEEYRTNFNNEVPTAVQAHDFLNGYIEDDSGKLFGDFLLDASDDDLVEVFLQANGQVVIVLQEQLAKACDTAGRTWLDRMVKVGSYDKLKKQYVNAYNGNTSKAKKAMDAKYHEKALILAENWEDVHQHFEQMESFRKKYGLDMMSEEEGAGWISAKLSENADKTNEIAADLNVYVQEKEMLEMLAMYSYDGATLLDFFAQDYEDISGDNLYKLYPLASCLSDGQMASINETVSVFQLIVNASMETVFNDYDLGMSSEIKEDLDNSEEAEIEEIKKEAEDSLEIWESKAPISIYEGVDRGIYDGGVAVTSIAETYSVGKGQHWTDCFVESGLYAKTAIGMAAGSVFSAAASVACALAVKYFSRNLLKEAFSKVNANHMFYSNTRISYDVSAYCQTRSFEVFERQLAGGRGVSRETQKLAMQTRNELLEKGMASGSRLSTAYKVFQALKIGFAVLCVLLAIADITMTIITLYNYYNRDHIPIPKYMVDLTYDENKETSFVSYKNASDQNGGEGDLNGGGGKQWLALYYTKDKEAGDPIMAPTKDSDIHQLKVLKGSGGKVTPSGYSPVHMFGYPNASQNLTYADGETGWSFNDKAGGTYLYYQRDPNYVAPIDDEEESEQADEPDGSDGSAAEVNTADDGNTSAESGEGTGTVVSNTKGFIGIFLGALGGLLIGLIVGIGRNQLLNRKKKKAKS